MSSHRRRAARSAEPRPGSIGSRRRRVWGGWWSERCAECACRSGLRPADPRRG